MTKKISVAFILPGLGYISRGSETAFAAYIAELSKNERLDITVFIAGKNYYQDGVRIVRIPTPMRHVFKHFPSLPRLYLKHDHGWESLFFSLLLIPVLLFYRIDIMVFTDAPYLLVPLWIYKKLRNSRVKTIFNSGGGLSFFYSRYFWADVVTATDPSSDAFFAKKFNTALIVPGVSEDYYTRRPQAKEKLHLPTDKLVIFSSSAHVPAKRLDFLIKAAGSMTQVYVALSSGGPMRAELEKLGRERLGENIRFAGYVDRETLMEYYSAADVFCLPSIVEPFGLVLIESMAAGTPVVTNASDIQRWIVGDGGSCVDVEDEAALIAALESYRDEARRREVGKRAVENARRFSWSHAAKQYSELFEKLMDPTTRA